MRNYNLRFFFLIILGFITATIIGTVSHEGGHYAVGKYLGYHPRINYFSTDFSESPADSAINVFYDRYDKEISAGKDFPGRKEFEKLVEKRDADEVKILAGGPLQTMIFGTIGLVILLINRKKFYRKKELSFGQWAVIFLSLFWLRQVFNAVCGIAVTLGGKDLSMSAMRGDEVNLSLYYHLPVMMLNIITGLIGAIIACIVIFRFIPKKQRTAFILAGLLGGIIGFILWMDFLGPVIMP